MPGEQDVLCFVVLVAAGVKLQSTWEDVKASGCREMLVLCSSQRLQGRSRVSIRGYSIDSNLLCGNASCAVHFSTVLGLKSGFSLALHLQPLLYSTASTAIIDYFLLYIFMKMNIKIVLDSLCASFST